MTGRNPRVYPRSKRARRVWLVASLLLVLAGAALEAASAARSHGHDLPPSWPVASTHEGDVGRYTHTTVRLAGPSVDMIEPEIAARDFQWTSPAQVRDASGARLLASRLVIVDQQPSEVSPDPGQGFVRSGSTVRAYEPSTARLVAVETTRLAQLPVDSPQAPGLQFADVYIRYVPDSSFAAPCGLTGPMHQGLLQTRGPVRPFRDCSIAGRAAGGDYRVLGTESLAGHPTLALERTDVRDGRILVWLASDIPYPMRMAAERGPASGVFDVYRLARFSSGAGPTEPAPTQDVPPAPIAWSHRPAWSLDDPQASMPFTLERAFDVASKDPGHVLARFLSDHPAAYLQRAEFSDRSNDARGATRTWSFAVVDAKAALSLRVVQHATVPGPLGPIGDILLTPSSLQATYEVGPATHPVETFGRRPAPESLPTLLPTLASLESRWRDVFDTNGALEEARGWSFALVCDREDCEAPLVELGMAADPVPGPGGAAEVQRSILRLDPRGALVDIERPGASAHGDVAAGSAAGLDFAAADLHVDLVSPWWSGPLAAASLLAGLAGLLAAAWSSVAPTIKTWFGRSLAFGALFSRLNGDEVIEHPARRSLVTLIEASPGIHLQELIRRAGHPGGTTRHHLAKLVAAGVVIEQVGTGYTCYFARGRVDRVVMRAWPVLKSPGAVRVLEAALARPGSSAVELANVTRLNPRTVCYHAKRMGVLGLLDVRQDGRRFVTTPTPAALQALNVLGAARPNPAASG